jgi:hypothetical protein
MTVRIAVAYAATDGRLPESVEVEWHGIDAVTTDDVVTVLDRLLAAPAKASPWAEADAAMPFMAAEPLTRGTWAGCVMDRHSVVGVGDRTTGVMHRGLVEEDLPRGALLVWGAPTDLDMKEMTWRRAD